ncbi:hypothetical protein OID55_10850 [Streptomyces sp. NBC_00715]|uniref:hypothetical protein n=1 Tax=Streptomyces sp. NBC_00715 TaxID=2975811 RepID=UPI00386F8349
MEGWNFWWGIAAFFLGGLATQLNGWLAYRRQRKDRADDAVAALRQRREEFELQHLVEVNQLLRDCMARCARLLLLEWRNATPPSGQVTNEAREELRSAEQAYVATIGELSSQIGFVFNDQVRQKIKEAAEYMNRRSSSPVDDADRGRTIIEMHHLVNDAHEALTDRVRGLYAGRARS